MTAQVLPPHSPDIVVEADDFPLQVVPDWDAWVERDGEVCHLSDRHLAYEA